MPAIRITDAIRVNLVASSNTAGLLLHVFHVKNPGGVPGYGDCEAVASAFKDWVNADYKNMCTTDVTFRRVVATARNAVPGAQAAVIIGTDGVRSGTPAPHTISCSVRLGTRSSGRRRHGWAKAFGMSRDDMVVDRFTPAYVTALRGVFNNLGNRLVLLGYPWAIASDRDAAVYEVREVDVLDDLIDSQDTRRAEHGR